MKGKHLIYFNLAIIGIFLFVIGCGGGGSSGGAIPNPTTPPTTVPTVVPTNVTAGNLIVNTNQNNGYATVEVFSTSSADAPYAQIQLDSAGDGTFTGIPLNSSVYVRIYTNLSSFQTAPNNPIAGKSASFTVTNQTVVINVGTVDPTPTGTVAPTPTNTPGTAQPEWLVTVNQHRALAGLPPVTENTTWSAGCYNHSVYLVKNDIIAHAEDPNLPYYTAEGNTAGSSSNVRVSTNDETGQQSVDGWMVGPFHGVGIIDPEFLVSGYGEYYENIPSHTWDYGATLDVIRGLGSVPGGITFPIMWPGNGSTVPLNSYNGNESPDPLSNSGYTPPSGLPIIIQLGAGSITPSVTNTSLTTGGNPVEHFWYDETNYTNSDIDDQNLGRAVLGSRDAVVIMPRNILTAGATYNVSVTANGNTYNWSFTVASAPRNMELKSSHMTMPVNR